MLLLGAGFGLAMPALTGLAMSDAGPEDAGVASGLFNTTQVMGGALEDVRPTWPGPPGEPRRPTGCERPDVSGRV